MEAYLVFAILMSMKVLITVAAPTPASSCGLDPNLRRECGWPGITEQQCESKGCCYDSKIPTSLWCFKKAEQSQDTDFSESEMQGLVFSTCSVKHQDKTDCGWPGIKQEICESRGCCYNEKENNSSWCFYAKTVFVQPITEHIMRCTANCTGLSWTKTAKFGVACKTNSECWKKGAGLLEVSCMDDCKNSDEVTAFAKNVSQCLSIDTKTSNQTIEKCDFGLECWIERHGKSATSCFKQYSHFLTGVSPPLPDKGVIARQPYPEIQMERMPYSEMLEPNFSPDMRWLLNRDPDTSVTDIDIEKQSGVHPVEILNSEEESNPNYWWLRGRTHGSK